MTKPLPDATWHLRRYREGDESGINDLFRIVFQRERSQEEWRWKFKEGPLRDFRFIHLAQAGERIVGQLAAMVVRFQCQGREALAVQVVDNMIDPAFRGGFSKSRMQRTLFSDCEGAIRAAGIALGFGFPNREAYRIGIRLLGYRDLGTVDVRSCPLSWVGRTRRLLGDGRFARGVGRLQAAARSLLHGSRTPLLAGALVRRATSFDESFDRLWKRLSSSFAMAVVRDRQFLQWRYREKPGTRYTILTLEREGELLGYAVLAVRRSSVSLDRGLPDSNRGSRRLHLLPRPPRTGLVADILCLPLAGAVEELLRGSLRFFLEAGMDQAECWSPQGGRYEEAIRTFFPRTLPEPVRAVCKIYDPAIDERVATQISQWHITLGDSDGV